MIGCELCLTLCDPMDTRLLCPWDCPGKNTGVGCYALLQGIFPTQEMNSHLLCPLHWQVGSLPLSTTWEAPGEVLVRCWGFRNVQGAPKVLPL